ncbi:helix-turn-helix domain-containing protein [Brevibacillus porteri]|uniref:Transcriptional regulator n=2 Tax=Brevibacillus porteri TaxID=2126350 RepID=A0ABX5FPL4_9BACL|nr:helix-turn-helix domain-containing protein [Brevibacillus porteri]MED2893344.1 AraC family transcriptional regulator [Brevibacillus porteri]PSK09896.1 transcriptional regulator [Brevibacillus porteri]
MIGNAVLMPTPLFLLQDIQQVTLSPTEAWTFSGGSTHAVLIVTKGTGRMLNVLDQATLLDGSVLVLSRESARQVRADTEDPLRFLVFYFDALQQSDQVTNAYSPSLSWHLDHSSCLFHQVDHGTELALTLFAHRQTIDPLEAFQNQIRFQQLLNLIWSHAEQQSTIETSNVVDQTLSYIHTNYAEPITLDDLANRAGLTPRYYSEVFKKKVGKSPIEYLTSCRMEHAKTLLRESNKRLREVARLVGYADEFYFSRRFKQQIGVSPTVFVRMNQKQMAPVTFHYAEYLLALGIRPVGAPEEQVTYLREQLRMKEADEIVSLPENTPDLIEPLQPTFILTESTGDCATFSKIAPTLALPWLAHDVFGHLNILADVLCMKDQAHMWLRQHEQKVLKAKRCIDAHIQKEETFLILNVRPQSLFAYGARNIGHVLYKSLKLTPPRIIQEELTRNPNFWATKINENQLSQYAADWLFVHIFDDDLSRAHFKELMKQDVWQRIPAVQKGQVVILNPIWFSYDPLSLDIQLEEIVQILTHSNTTTLSKEKRIILHG